MVATMSDATLTDPPVPAPSAMVPVAPAPAPPEIKLTDRARALFTRRITLPGWALLLVGAFNFIPDFKGRIEFWTATTKAMGGHLAMVAVIVASPYFAAGLIVAGISYLLFVGQPKQALQHPIWALLGLIVSIVSIAALVAVAGYGAFEIELRRLANDRAIEIVKGNNPTALSSGEIGRAHV